MSDSFILCLEGWWQECVSPLYNSIVDCVHLAAQKEGLTSLSPFLVPFKKSK